MSCDLESWSEILPDQKSTSPECGNKYKGWRKVRIEVKDEWKVEAEGRVGGRHVQMVGAEVKAETEAEDGRRWQVTKSEVETVWGKGVPLTDTKCSTFCYIFTMAGGPVTWSSKWHATVVLSTVEAEYVAISLCTQQMMWMQDWLDKVGVKHNIPGIMKGDSSGTIVLMKNTKDHSNISKT